MGNTKIKIIEIEGKGEFRIPKSVLEKLPFAPQGRFMIMQGKDFITIKKIGKPSPQEKFRSVAQEVQKKVKVLKINKKLVDEAIEWSRKK